MSKLGYIGIDQYGNHYHIKKYPRKELIEQIGIQHVKKMCIDKKDGSTDHVGYVIGDHWIEVFEIHSWGGRS